jgi:hypothetical protein
MDMDMEQTRDGAMVAMVPVVVSKTVVLHREV